MIEENEHEKEQAIKGVPIFETRNGIIYENETWTWTQIKIKESAQQNTMDKVINYLVNTEHCIRFVCFSFFRFESFCLLPDKIHICIVVLFFYLCLAI